MTRETWRAPRLAAVAGALLGVLALTAATATADEWGQRTAGKHVYDAAGVLSAQQVADLEARAAAVDEAGAPTVVYLRLKDADDPTTRQDARALMDAWAIETSPGARDGFVLLLNLKPADPRHGSVALIAGQANTGRLPGDQLQSIYQSTMRPHLASGDLTGAVSAALTRVEGDLRTNVAITPRPAPSVLEQAADVGGPLIGGAIAIAAVLIFGIIGFSGRWFSGYGPRRTRVTGDDGGSSGWSGWSGGDGGASISGGDGGASSGSSSGGGSF